MQLQKFALLLMRRLICQGQGQGQRKVKIQVTIDAGLLIAQSNSIISLLTPREPVIVQSSSNIDTAVRYRVPRYF